jgi:hypothetical protein
MQNGQGRNISKWAFISSVAILLGGLAFGFGLYSGAKRNAIFDLVRNIRNDVTLVYSEFENLGTAGEPIHFLQPSRKPGTGVTVNKRANDGNLVLLSSFFDGGNEIRLLRRDGSLVARWPVSFSAHFPDVSHLKAPPQTDRNVDLHGVLIQPDGSVVLNYEYSGTVKLSRCGETVWTLAHPTHHSIEFAEGGGYWIPGHRFISGAESEGFPPFTRMDTNETFYDDLILRVTKDGVIAEQISVARILYDNGLEPVMTAGGYSFRPNGTWGHELVHVNKIGELPSSIADAFQGFEAGDLVLSLRGYNLVLVVDPDDWRVKWHQTGPWRRQHDPEFNPDGTITVFNNNTYRLELGERDRSNPATPRVSNIMRVDPATGRTEVVYGERAGQEFLSVIRGKHDLTPEGGFLITEFEAGRVFEVDAQGRIVWEYINRYDAEQVLEITEARLYPSSYFTVEDWSCPSTTASN